LKYRREIDGLRAVAVVPVIFFHAGFALFSGGFVGVDVFFVISGYLITSIILADKEQGTFSLIHFYERRARRILPALFLVMLVCLPFAWFWLLPHDMKDFSKSLVAASMYVSNLFFWYQSGYFDTAAKFKPLLHTWSLAVEEQYYAFFPLLLMATWRLGRRYFFAAICLIAVVSLTLAEWSTIYHPNAAFFLLPTRAWELMAGGIIAFLIMYRERFFQVLHSRKGINEALGLLGLLMICYAVVAFDKTIPFPGIYAIVPTVGTALIILFVSSRTTIGRLLGSRILVGIGLISYSAYLWHVPLFVFARQRSLTEPGTGTLLALSALSIILAYFSWRFVERPFRQKGRISRRRIFGYGLGGMIFFIIIGAVGSLSQGLPGLRFSKKTLETISKVSNLRMERFKLIRIGECQFNKSVGPKIDEFIKEWNCYDDDASNEYSKLPVAVIGDSESADIDLSLKSSGYLPMQISGAGCSLAPSLMKNYCKKLFSSLRSRIEDDERIKYIVLANRYTRKELTLPILKETIDYWSGFGKKLVFFTAMPEFGNFKKRIFKRYDGNPDIKIVRYSERGELYDYLRSRGVHVVSTSSIFCNSLQDCGFLDEDGRLLMTDGHHLSKTGAKIFGERLLSKDPLFRSLTGTK